MESITCGVFRTHTFLSALYYGYYFPIKGFFYGIAQHPNVHELEANSSIDATHQRRFLFSLFC